MKDLSFTAAGQTVAILGDRPKSTIALLLQRLHAPQSGIPLRARHQDYRAQHLAAASAWCCRASVFQDHLRQPAHGRPGRDPGAEAAAEDAQALEFILQSDKG